VLPNYLMPSSGYGSGTAYNFGNPITIGLTTIPSDSWWLNFAPGTAVGPGIISSSVTYTPTCDNSTATNSNFTQPSFDVPNNEYILPLGNIDYVYSNGSTVDSYAYYIFDKQQHRRILLCALSVLSASSDLFYFKISDFKSDIFFIFIMQYVKAIELASLIFKSIRFIA